MLTISNYDAYLALKRQPARQRQPYIFDFPHLTHEQNARTQAQFAEMSKYCGCNVGAVFLYVGFVAILGYLAFFIGPSNLKMIHLAVLLGGPILLSLVGKSLALGSNALRKMQLGWHLRT